MGAYRFSPSHRTILPPHLSSTNPSRPQLTLCEQDPGFWTKARLVPLEETAGNPTPSGQPSSDITLVWGGGWPGAKGEKGMIQTHTMAIHTFPTSRTQGPTPSQGNLASEILRRGQAEEYLPTVLPPQALSLALKPLHPSLELLMFPKTSELSLPFSMDALLPGGHPLDYNSNCAVCLYS